MTDAGAAVDDGLRASAAGAVRGSGQMGFDDLFNKSKKLFADGKDKVTDFVESEKGEQLIDKSKRVFEDGKGKVTEFFDSDKGDGAGGDAPR